MKNSRTFTAVAFGIAGLLAPVLIFGPSAIARSTSSAADRDLNALQSQKQQKRVPAGTAADLESLLAGKPALKSRIVWVTGDGKRQPFDQWTPQMKSRIEGFYQKLMRGEKNLVMHLPTVDKIDPRSGAAYFTADQAFDSYAAYAAHVLYVEAKRLVPWSIANRPAVEVDVLLASESYFSRILPSANTDSNYPAGIKANRDFAEPPEDNALGELNGDPRIGFDFVSGKTSASHKSLIGKNELETLAHLTVWLRDNFGHGAFENQIKHSAAQRWLPDRLTAAPGLAYAVANIGCHSASKMMVDLARSVNIPLLHVRAQESESTDGHFFNRTHGGLVYGWGGPEPRILWHTDEIYAIAGEPSFPLDEHTGTLAKPEIAAQMYFDQRWVSPQTLIKAGFAYKLERVFPEKGFGKSSAHEYEDRGDYGMMIGYWRNRSGCKFEEIFRLSQDYTLYGETLLMLSCKNSLVGQLKSNIEAWKGSLPDAEFHMLRPVKDYDERAKAWLKAVGGCQKYQELYQQWQNNRGKNLMRKEGGL
jgi:hypothetical protein